MSIVIGCIKQESNSFCPVPATLDSFEIHYGADVITNLRGSKTEVSGFLSILDDANYDLSPTISASAVSGGYVTIETFRYLQGELIRRIQETPTIEAVLLSMHGAMVTADCDDTEGDTLQRVRKIVGPDIPIVLSLDPHAHVSQTMMDCADIIVAYHTFPHVDQFETGQRAAALLIDMLGEKLEPVIESVRIPVMIGPEAQPDYWSPMLDIQALCRSLEGVNGVRAVNYCPVQPWLDIPNASQIVVVVADQNRSAAKEAASIVAQKVWDVRHEFVPVRMLPNDAVRHAISAENGCYILTEPYDSTAAGAPGDSAALLRALVEEEVTVPAMVAIVDPQAVEAAYEAGIGQPIRVSIGYQLDPRWGEPVEIEGIVEILSDEGKFIFQMTGTPEFMGKTAVIRSGSIMIVVCEHSFMHLDPNVYRSLGLEPSEARIVGVKSTIHFRAFYTSIATEIIMLDAVGSSSGRFEGFEWKRLSRPVWPLDEIQWSSN